MICRKGGAGKTTIGVHLAVEAQRRGARVLVIDTDPQASAARVLDRRGEQPPDVVTQHASLLLRSVDQARVEGFDLVVIDTPPQADQAPLTAAKAADMVIVPMRPSIVDIDAIQTTIETCELARKVPIFVLNAVSPTGTEANDTAEFITAKGGRVVQTRIGVRKVYSQAFTLGMTAFEINPRGVAAREIATLFDDLGITMPRRLAQRHRRTTSRVGE